MANRTVKDAATVKGTNPQFLVEKIIRHRIYDSKYWKEECFALTSELVVDKGMELRYIGGIYAGNVKPTPFLCLLLKLLQLQPEKDIIIEFIRQEEYKYIRALGAIYLRMVFNSVEIFKYLEPLYNDYRKLRVMNNMGRFELLHVDEFIDKLLREDRVFDVQMPRLQKRLALEQVGAIEEYVSALDEDLDKISESDSEPEERRERKREKPRLVSRKRSRSRERDDRRERKERDRSRDRDRDRRRRSRSRDRDRDDRKDRERERRDVDRRDKDRERDKEKDKDKRKQRQSSVEREISEANAQRAQLGLAPLER